MLSLIINIIAPFIPGHFNLLLLQQHITFAYPLFLWLKKMAPQKNDVQAKSIRSLHAVDQR